MNAPARHPAAASPAPGPSPASARPGRPSARGRAAGAGRRRRAGRPVVGLLDWSRGERGPASPAACPGPRPSSNRVQEAATEITCLRGQTAAPRAGPALLGSRPGLGQEPRPRAGAAGQRRRPAGQGPGWPRRLWDWLAASSATRGLRVQRLKSRARRHRQHRRGAGEATTAEPRPHDDPQASPSPSPSAFAVIKAPAALLGGLLATSSGGGLILQQAEGSLWQGAVLASRDAGGRSLTPGCPWPGDFDAGALARLAMGWDFPAAAALARRARPRRLALSGLALHAPAGRPGGHAPGRPRRLAGRPEPGVPRWRCPADGRCSGEASLLWRGAGSAVFRAASLRRLPGADRRPAGACASTDPTPARHQRPAARAKRPYAASPASTASSGRPGPAAPAARHRRRRRSPALQPGQLLRSTGRPGNPSLSPACISSQNCRLADHSTARPDP